MHLFLVEEVVHTATLVQCQEVAAAEVVCWVWVQQVRVLLSEREVRQQEEPPQTPRAV